MLVQTASDMDRCAATFATTAYVIANMEQRLPRDGPYPVDPSSAPRMASSLLPLFTCMVCLINLVSAAKTH